MSNKGRASPPGLSVTVVCVASAVMGMVVLAGGKRGACKGEQHKGGNDELLHVVKRSTNPTLTAALSSPGTKPANRSTMEWHFPIRNGLSALESQEA